MVTAEQQADLAAATNNSTNVYTFFEEVDELFRGQNIRYTRETPPKVSVYDVIRVITGTTNPHIVYARLKETHAGALTNSLVFLFEGQGQHPTPITDAAGIIEIINLLPGTRAARFRKAGARVLVRVLGGDETLVTEIRENAGRLEALATDSGAPHHMLQFKLPEGCNISMAQRAHLFSPSMDGKTVCDFVGPCTYILLFTHEEKLAIKFGSSRNVKERMREHARTYPDMRVWCVIECSSVEHAEETESLFKDKMASFLFSVTLPPNQHTYTEVLLNVPPEVAEQHMRSAHDIVMQRCTSNTELEFKRLEIEKLKIEAEMMKLEVEKMRLEIELKRIGCVAM